MCGCGLTADGRMDGPSDATWRHNCGWSVCRPVHRRAESLDLGLVFHEDRQVISYMEIFPVHLKRCQGVQLPKSNTMAGERRAATASSPIFSTGNK
jgi:hypothetical protein